MTDGRMLARDIERLDVSKSRVVEICKLMISWDEVRLDRLRDNLDICKP